MNGRIRFVFLAFLVGMILVAGRLFYWQIQVGERLASAGESQHRETYEIHARRGEIRTSDGFPLATINKRFLIYAYTPNLRQPPGEIAAILAPILATTASQEASPTAAASPRTDEPATAEKVRENLSRDDVLWVPLIRDADETQKERIENLNLAGIGIEESFKRHYPEATMAASLLGFVGSDTAGNPKGYFGLEGYYDLELRGRPGVVRHEKDASGRPILIGRYDEIEAKDGRNLVLHLDRAIQRIVERQLSEGLRKYRAKKGEVIILDPASGAVLAMAALPAYDPVRFRDYTLTEYKNPTIAETYEPGSTFKVLVMAAALDSNAVTPETRCTACDGPLTIGSHTIRTWNNQYRGILDMREIIQYSDNVGMVFVAERLGVDRLYDYLTRFGIGDPTGIDLEEETTPRLRETKEWKSIDLATASFGQGIAVTAIQMTRAVGAIANRGILMVPQVVARVEGEASMQVRPVVSRRVISEQTANIMTELMVNAVENGEARWAKPQGIRIAGKTGTAQIPVAGHYDEEKTIASFVGFAPDEKPRFVMIVKLTEPQSSPWGSETAAPLWFSIAEDLLNYFGIPRQDS